MPSNVYEGEIVNKTLCVFLSRPKRIKCSNQKCNNVFLVVDNMNPLINDPGFVVKKCPKCGALVRFFVNNTDEFDNHSDTEWVCEADDLDDKTMLVPEGRELIDGSIIQKTPIWSPDDYIDIWTAKGGNRAIPCEKQVQRKIEEIENELNSAY